MNDSYLKSEVINIMLTVMAVSKINALIFSFLFKKMANEKELACLYERGEEVIFRKHIEFFYVMIKLGDSMTVMSLIMLIGILLGDIQ